MEQVITTLSQNIIAGSRIAILGVGSPLRADDSVGLYIVTELMARLKTDSKQEFRFYLGESAPENFTGEIRSFEPTHLLIFDAAEQDEIPGTFALIAPNQIGGTSFSTHMLPLKMLTDYLSITTGCAVLVVGIQPKYLEFAEPLSTVVKDAADRFIDLFTKALQKEVV